MHSFKLLQSSKDPRFNEIFICEITIVVKKFDERFFKDKTPETSIGAVFTGYGRFDFKFMYLPLLFGSSWLGTYFLMSLSSMSLKSISSCLAM